jgi:SAM-dependent methyltransferase
MLPRIGRALAAYHHRAIHRPRVRRVARSLAAQIGGAASLLDVGCGDGTMAADVAARVGAQRLAGIDVSIRPDAIIQVRDYDGRKLPYPDESFEIVVLADVLHHAEQPEVVLREALRVAERGVALKDHLSFGVVSSWVLLVMDHVGNAAPGVTVRGHYLSLQEWFELVSRAGGRIRSLRWPLRIHDLPWRLVTRSELQFTAFIEPLGAARQSGTPSHLPGATT